MSHDLSGYCKSVLAGGVLFLLLSLSTALGQPALADNDQVCMASCLKQGVDKLVCARSCSVLLFDHRCLSLCMAQPQNGSGVGPRQSGSSCTASCTYIKPEALTPLAPARSNSHSQFTEMVPADPNTITLPLPAAPGARTSMNNITPRTQPLGPSTNYKCVAQCSQQGMSLGYCTQNCSY